jgi:hypothetical protein
VSRERESVHDGDHARMGGRDARHIAARWLRHTVLTERQFASGRRLGGCNSIAQGRSSRQQKFPSA